LLRDLDAPPPPFDLDYAPIYADHHQYDDADRFEEVPSSETESAFY